MAYARVESDEAAGRVLLLMDCMPGLGPLRFGLRDAALDNTLSWHENRDR
jgi:hypothetical protein